MFGVGSTVGTGIFFALSESAPGGPLVIVSFIIAGVAAGLAVICYAELASAVPVSSTYPTPTPPFGEVVAMGVAARLLLEYGCRRRRSPGGAVRHKLLENFFGHQPLALSAAPGMPTGHVNLPAVVLVCLRPGC